MALLHFLTLCVLRLNEEIFWVGESGETGTAEVCSKYKEDHAFTVLKDFHAYTNKIMNMLGE